MSSLFLMIPLGLLLLVLGILLFVWALRNGQFEDLDGPAWSIFMDEEKRLDDKDAAKSPKVKSENSRVTPE